MLRLENITKKYRVADSYVDALKGIDLVFRKNEFVSILGPSGCGKTTLLNIIGGLDKYTTGDLFINGRSTKEFKDSDWDIYRNHRIGFIFQSYNLIPHQTILGNVELALTIAGLSKEERIQRAKKAIDRVGLGGQYHKKPNQLSGGQCQRVAIARALVNEPEILLADEPTGALDTQTSVQIMDLIREISKEKLVIMVTHNPELANQYSSRIVKLLDGLVVSDSNPFTKEEEAKEKLEVQEVEEIKENISENVKKKPKKEKAKMSFWTAFKLSLKNLATKKARTALVCVAGSIGIIGVSSVLAVSSGVQGYITSMQDDMLSGNPVQINETAYDISAMMNGLSNGQKLDALEIVDGKVNVESVVGKLIKQNTATAQMQIKNNISKEYIDYIKAMPNDYAAAITLLYDIDVTNNIYTNFKVNSSDQGTNLSLSAIRNIYTSVLKETEYGKYASYVTGLTDVFQQAPNDENYILSQYDLIAGDGIATKENEIMIVIDSKSELTDLLLAQLGYFTQDEFINSVFRYAPNADGSVPNKDYDKLKDKNRFDYEELLGKEFYFYPNDDIYQEQTVPMLKQSNPFTYKHIMDPAKGEKFVVKGILRPKEDISYGCMTSGFFYTEAFTKKFIASGTSSKIVKYLEDDPDKESFTSMNYQGMPVGITYNYEYYDMVNKETKTTIGFVGNTNAMTELLGAFMGSNNDSIYTLTLREIGGVDLANHIHIYPINFDLKDEVTNYLDAWNGNAEIRYVDDSGKEIVLAAKDRDNITYTDNIALVINLINSLINLVTTALIAFTCLSLVVSCFMIAIITYVSVVERVKEIGVIRSLGGSKKDVTHLFNAETFIIGLISGLFGILVTYLLSFILNIIVKAITGVYPIAALPLWQALVMILVSILLTIISGLIPARSAAKKDPVVALRTE